MEQVTIIGIDISKRSFQLHGATAEGKPVFGKKLSREKFLVFLSEAPPCLVVMEACGGAHYWGRQIIALGHRCMQIPPIYVKPFLKRGRDRRGGTAPHHAVRGSEVGRSAGGCNAVSHPRAACPPTHADDEFTAGPVGRVRRDRGPGCGGPRGDAA